MAEKLSQIRSVVYGALTEREIVNLSVAKITKPSSQGNTDKSSQKDKKNRKRDTPYDPRLGCLENGMLCETCKKDNKECPGHFGYIDLPIPIYNKTYMNYILKILQCVCHVCARPRINEQHIQMTNIARSKGNKKLSSFVRRCKKIVTCPWDDCNTLMQFYHFNKVHVKRYIDSKLNDVEFKAGEALNIFMRISDETLEFLGFNNDLLDNPKYIRSSGIHAHKFRPESMIITKLLVIPSVARPYVVRDGQEHDDDLTDKYNSIIKACNKLREDDGANILNSGLPQKGRKKSCKLKEEDRKKVEEELQMHIWSLMNNKDEKSKLSSGGRAHKCLFQRIQGKEGIVQSNIGGKRVDFSSRSVIIGGGIFLKLNQVGVPECAAKELTIPLTVNANNKEYLQGLLEKGKINRIVRGREVKRLNIPQAPKIHHELMIGDKVEKQLQDGDPFPFNRQPTLKMEGFMSFRVKIISGYAYRLGLAWTTSFNADFDGDEMNAHVPQSIPALAETSILMRAEAHIVSGQSNAPVNGIVQDGLVASYILTNTWINHTNEPNFSDNTMVPIHIFKECIEGAEISESRCTDMLIRASKYYPEYISITRKGPVFRKNKIPGKIMMSILFPKNLNYKKVTDTNPNYPVVEIENGIILPKSGPLCKKIIGSKANSVIHILWIEYSPDETLRFISDCQQITDRWFPNYGFSMGIWDCMASSDEDVEKTLLEMKLKIGAILEKCNGIPNYEEEMEINSILNSAMNVGLTLSKTSMAKADKNALNIMRNSGAKGSLVNLTQIVAFVGQQNINGQRIPTNLTGKTRTLPHFQPNDHTAEARGFVSNGYLKGLTPTEVFFHAAAGRTGIISTSIKSVTFDTLITIYDDNFPITVKIGEWIDSLLSENLSLIEKLPEKDMEYLDILKLSKNCSIPTVDENGNVTWGTISAITRHDPTENLYKITTKYGREVTVAESKSLVVWNKELNKWEQNFPQNVKKGDRLPITRYLPVFNSGTKSFLELPEHIIENPHQIKMLECNRLNGYLIGAIISSCGILDSQTITLKPRFASCKKTLHTIYHALKKLKFNFCEYEGNEIGISSIVLKEFVRKLSMDLNILLDTPSCFREGIIDGYLSFGASFSNGRIKVEDKENYYIPEYNFINMLCNQFGVVTKKIDVDCFTIKGVYLTILKHTVGLTNSFLNHANMLEYEYCGEFLNDVHFDEIKKIEKIKTDGKKLYDMTVPSTLNFCLASGLHVADTSDTGYIQKKIGRKIEDCKAHIDGTVRTSNGRIIQFLYGDDGMNPKFLYVPKNLDFPFFVNPNNIAKRFNSDAVFNSQVRKGEKPRKLYEEEIELTLSFIHAGPPYLKSEVIEVATNTTRSILKKLLLDPELVLYECIIPDFCVELKNMYEAAKIQYGEMVGLHTASFIGEPTTQMMLDSVTYETEILVKNRRGYIFKVQIGEFVNKHIQKSKRVEYYQDKDMTWAGLDEEEYYEIMSATEDGRTEWCRIEGVSKHPVINEDGSNTMLKVTTEYCKEVTATKAKSFLQLIDGKIQEIDGDQLKVGDYIPVSFKQIEYTFVYDLDMKDLFPPNEYLYTSELAKAKIAMNDCRRWWLKHAGKTFILPHTRSDSVVRLIQESPQKGMMIKTSYLLKDNCVYMKQTNGCDYAIPEKIPLDYNFGYLIGAYCAEGCMTKHQLSIANNDENYFEPIKELCKKWNITTKYYVQHNKGKEGWTSSDLRIYNTLLCRLLEKLCGKLSHNKFVSDKIVFSNEACQRGFLDAYIGGDGCVGKHDISMASTSLKMLTDVNVMLKTLGIYSYIKKDKTATKDKIFPTYTTKLENIKQGYVLFVTSQNCYKLAEILTMHIGYKKEPLEKLICLNYKPTEKEKFIYNKINGETIKEYRKGRCPDLHFEKIVDIEEVQNTTNYAYDLSVSTTKNFDSYLGLCLRDTFHSTGLKGKDVSLGVPRFNELLNATKSNKQKKISQTIHFDIPEIKENAEKIRTLAKEPNKDLEIKELKTANLIILEKLKKNFQETKVGTFVKNFEMKYLSEDVNPDVNMSPIKILTYEEYEKKWWVSLREELYEPPKIPPQHWVVILYFDMEQLYTKGIELEDIAIMIENDSEDKYYCCASPSPVGEIEVYCNYSVMKEYVRNGIKIPDSEKEGKSLLTGENINYFICRDVIIDYLCNIKLTGIFGIKKVYPRETESGEWVMDADCREIQSKTSNHRFLESLNSKGVDPYNTVVDDMHTILTTLGIEAARKFLIEELTRIISFDGVYINPRHIQLLADSMTYTGEITSVRRDGISRDVGPNAKIMFEQAVDNAVEASAFSEIDDMKGVSSAIMYGLTSKAGTGTVEIKPEDQIPITPPIRKEDIKGIDITKLEEIKDEENAPALKIETPDEKRKRKNNLPGSNRKNIIRKRS